MTCVALGLSLSGCSTDSDPTPPQGSDAKVDPVLAADLQSTLDQAVANQVTPGVAIYVSQEGATWSGASGVRDIESGAPLPANDHFLDPSMAGASGGHALVTTPADLGHFLEKLREGALFDHPETLDSMVTFHDAPDPQMHMVGYGYGFMQLQVDSGEAIGHLGGTAGYRSFVLYAPATHRYLAGFMNVMGDLGAVLLPIIARLEQP